MVVVVVVMTMVTETATVAGSLVPQSPAWQSGWSKARSLAVDRAKEVEERV